MIKKILALFCLLICFSCGYSQDYKLVGEVILPEGHFTTDPIGNIYWYNRGDVTKYSPLGVELNRFSTRDFGEISHIDATNPLKILVVFQEFSKALILDASLGRNSIIDFTSSNMPFVKLICISRENGFWIFDPVDKRIKRVSDQLDVVGEGTPLRQITEDPLEPNQLIDSGNWLIMNVPDYGILVFDRFGTYFKTIRPPSTTLVQANGDDILFKEDTQMTQIAVKSTILKHFIIPENMPEDECRVEGSRIFLRKNNDLKIYSY